MKTLSTKPDEPDTPDEPEVKLSEKPRAALARINDDNYIDTEFFMSPADMIDAKHVREHLEAMPMERRQQAMAYLAGFMSQDRVAQVTGYSAPTISNPTRKYKHVREEAVFIRNMVISEACERKAFDAIQSINVANIPDEKKAQTAKYLMESALLAKRASRKEKEKGDNDSPVVELLMTVRKRLDRGDTAKDITVDVEED